MVLLRVSRWVPTKTLRPTSMGLQPSAADNCRLVHHSTIFELHQVESYRGKQAARQQKTQRDNDKANRRRQPPSANDNHTQEPTT